MRAGRLKKLIEVILIKGIRLCFVMSATKVINSLLPAKVYAFLVMLFVNNLAVKCLCLRCYFIDSLRTASVSLKDKSSLITVLYFERQPWLTRNPPCLKFAKNAGIRFSTASGTENSRNASVPQSQK